MNLAVKCVTEVNGMVDHDGIPLVRKSMIRSSLTLTGYNTINDPQWPCCWNLGDNPIARQKTVADV